jgi:hypothetical protein
VACITTYQQLLFRNHGYIHATIADCPALLEHTTNNEELFRNHGHTDATIDRVSYNRKTTRHGRGTQARQRIGTRSTEEYKRSAGEELTQCDYSKTSHYR